MKAQKTLFWNPKDGDALAELGQTRKELVAFDTYPTLLLPPFFFYTILSL